MKNIEVLDYAYKVISNRGAISVKDLLPGDYVCSAIDGHPMKVLKVIRLNSGPGYYVSYSDGRSSIYHEQHRIVYDMDGNEYDTEDMKEIIDHIFGSVPMEVIFGDIKQNRIDFSGIITPNEPKPVPYIAGPILVFGDRNDPCINIPINGINKYEIDTRIDIFINLYHIAKRIEISDGKMYFINESDDRISWEEMFHDMGILRVSNNNLIPDEYLYGSIVNRLHFVKGVFDFGYKKSELQDSIGICINNENVAIEFRKILSSLGIVASIQYDPNDHYIPTIINGIPAELFDDPNMVFNMLNNRQKYNYPSKLNVSSMNLLTPEITSYDIVLSAEDEGGVFLTDNMLPRPSVIIKD